MGVRAVQKCRPTALRGWVRCMKPIVDGLKALGAARLLALAGVGLAVLAMFAVLTLRGGGAGHFASALRLRS